MQRSAAAVGPFKALAPILEANYPERVTHAIIINAPWSFSALFNAFSSFIPSETKKKITVANKHWLVTLKSLLPEASIAPDISCDGLIYS